MQIRIVTEADIPLWQALSSEYDDYVRELVGDLTKWYKGNDKDDNSIAFDAYMKSKVISQEAFIATNNSEDCLGIIAFSKQNNRITFFGVSKFADFSREC